MTRVSAVEGHRLWAPFYDSFPNPVLSLERRHMSEILTGINPATVIDVACGSGHWMLHFQERGSSVFGFDACEEMLAQAQKNGPLRRLLAVSIAENIPVRDSVADLVICSLSAGYFPDIHRVFGEFARVARRGGLVAVSDLHPHALESGWTRSFKIGGEQYDMEHYRHSLRDVQSAATNAGLMAKKFRIASFGDAEQSVFRQAGKEELIRSLTAVAALFIGTWEKP